MQTTIEQAAKRVVLSDGVTPSEVRMFFWLILGGADFDALKLSRDTIERGLSHLRRAGFIEPVGDWWRACLKSREEKQPSLFDPIEISAKNPRGGDPRLIEYTEAAGKFLSRPRDQAMAALNRWFAGKGRADLLRRALDARKLWDGGVPFEWSADLDEALVEAEKWAYAQFKD